MSLSPNPFSSSLALSLSHTHTHKHPLLEKGDVSGMLELGCFQLPATVYSSVEHGVVHYYGATMGLRVLSLCLCPFKTPSIKCTCVLSPARTITPHTHTADRWMSFPQAVLWLLFGKPIVAAVIQAAGLRSFFGVGPGWSSWPGVGVWVWGRLDVLPNPLKTL